MPVCFRTTLSRLLPCGVLLLLLFTGAAATAQDLQAVEPVITDTLTSGSGTDIEATDEVGEEAGEGALDEVAPGPAEEAGDELAPSETPGAIDEASANDPSVTTAGFTEKPRWEFGIGGGYLQGFDYPASSDPNRSGIALPFFIYRSEVFRVGGGGLRAVAVERPRLRVDFSFGGGIASSSESDGVRAGMPDLDFLLQAGPRGQFIFTNRPTGDGGRLQLSMTAAVRAVISTDFGSADYQGLLAEIAFNATRRRVFGSQFDALARVSSTWTEDRLQEYFYEVPTRFATDTRPAFNASGGYLGTNVFLGGAYRPTRTLRLFAGVQFGIYSGAANEDSPLFETDLSTGFALGFAWTVKESSERVSIVDVDS